MPQATFRFPRVHSQEQVRVTSDSGGSTVVARLRADLRGQLQNLVGPDGVTTLYLQSEAGTTAVTGTVAGDGASTTQAAVDTAVAALVTGAPAALDTLDELAAALGDDANYAATVTTALAARMTTVSHGSTAGTARPTSALPVLWIGTVAPTNRATRDLWMDETAVALKRWDGSAWVASGGSSVASLTPTAVKTANYSAAASDYVPVDTTSGAVTVTLPTAPADKTQVGVKHVVRGGTNVVTIACGGSDVLNKTGGSTTGTLTLLNQSAVFQYKASTAVWYVVGADLPLSQLDSRYVTSVNGLSGAVTTVAGVRTAACSIPAGSLATWDAARNAAASAQRDVVVFGDSTTEGVPFSGNNTGGFIVKLRALMVAAGVTDGGRGIIDGQYDDANLSGESFAGFVSRTGWAATATGTFPGPNPLNSNTVGDVLTLQYKAPSNAMRVRYSSSAATGRLTVAVNGTTVGTIDPWAAQNQAGSQGTYGEGTKAFTGLTAGGTGQTVTITNTGGAPMPDPIQFRTAGTATTGGAVAPGNYTYAATFVDASGNETALSPKGNQTVPAGTSTNTVTTALDNSGASTGNVPAGITKARLYRATGLNITTPSSFQRVLEVTSSGGSQIILTDVGNAPGAAPPNASQNPQLDPANGGPKNASITVEFYDSTKGITIHRAGYSGQKYPLLFTPSNSTYATAGYDAQTHLGLATGLGAALGSTAYDWTVLPASRPNARNPALAICAFGINDMNTLDTTSATTIQAGVQAIINGVGQFIRLARAAGADPLVIIPHLDYAPGTGFAPYITLIRNAILNTADAYGSAWYDFGAALGSVTAARVTSYGYVHLTQSGYDAEATGLWNSVLSASAPR